MHVNFYIQSWSNHHSVLMSAMQAYVREQGMEKVSFSFEDRQIHTTNPWIGRRIGWKDQWGIWFIFKTSSDNTVLKRVPCSLMSYWPLTKFKKCLKQFETFMISSKTISFMKLFTLEPNELLATNKIQKVLETLRNFYDIIKNYFFHEIIYFGRTKNIFRMISKFWLKTKGGTIGITCTCKGGTTGKFQKIQKVLETLRNFYDMIKNYFFHEIIYFGHKKTCFEWFRNFDPKPKGGPQASLALAKRGPHAQGNFKNSKSAWNPWKLLGYHQKLFLSWNYLLRMQKNMFWMI